MKKLLCTFWGMLLCTLFSIKAMAAIEPVFILQPQNYIYAEGNYATYSVEVDGTNLRCQWYLEYNGKTYNISDTTNSKEPWEEYAGEDYGAYVDGNTFTYFFDGIQSELSGSYIYCILEDGHFEIVSEKVLISVDGTVAPPKIVVPSNLNIYQDEFLDLYCDATDSLNGKLEYVWYQTSTGRLQDIIAINRGTETNETLICDTSEVGEKYYVCMVTSSSGGRAYSSVIKVNVVKRGTKALPVIDDSSLADAVMGESYYFKLDCRDSEARFGIIENSYRKDGFDDTGLYISYDGIISGIPKAIGNYKFAIYSIGEDGLYYKTFTLTVKDPNETVIEILEVPDKLVYNMGERLDLTGLHVRVYTSRTSYFDSYNGENLTITKKNLMTVGEQKIKVSYGDAMDIFIVTVKDINIPFTDVKKGDWYYTTIKRVYSLGLMTGINETEFDPNSAMSRAMVVSVLHRMSGKPSVSYKKIFADISNRMWYTTPVIWAATNKIVNGYTEDNTFRPNENITREQVAVIIRNYIKSQGIDTSKVANLQNFKDDDKVSSWAKSAIGWAVENGIMSGTTDGYLNPKNNATRAECAKMLFEAYKIIEKNT